MACEKYPADKSAREPYDAAYCEEAMAAWADAPLQIVPIKKAVTTRDASAPVTPAGSTFRASYCCVQSSASRRA